MSTSPPATLNSYTILSASDWNDLQTLVNQYLGNGYVLWGGLGYTSDQTMPKAPSAFVWYQVVYKTS